MLFQFSDHIREGFEQSRNNGNVKLYVHGIGIVVVKIEQLKIIKLNIHNRELLNGLRSN